MTQSGVKYDEGKPRPDLVLGDFMIALEHPVFVGTFGAYKYEARNFHTLEGGEERYAEAGMRHYMERKKGAITGDIKHLFDAESGELHIAHEIWDKVAELFFWLKENGHRRFQKAVSSEINGARLYYHPVEDDFGSHWDEEPFWYNEADARQIIWHLAREQKGELDILVKVREIPAQATPRVPTHEELVDLFRPHQSVAREYVVQNSVDEYLMDEFKMIWTLDPDLATRMSRDCADKHVAGMPKGTGFVRPWPVVGARETLPLGYAIQSVSGDFWGGDAGWVDSIEDAMCLTDMEHVSEIMAKDLTVVDQQTIRVITL